MDWLWLLVFLRILLWHRQLVEATDTCEDFAGIDQLGIYTKLLALLVPRERLIFGIGAPEKIKVADDWEDLAVEPIWVFLAAVVSWWLDLR